MSVRPSAGAATALAQVALAAVAVIVAAALSGSPGHLWAAAGLLGTVALLAPLARARRWDALRSWHWSPAAATLVILAIGPCVAYAWSAATGSAQITDDTWGLDHWPVQAAFPLAVLLIAALAAGRPAGWRLPAWSAGAAAAWFAVVAWLEPHLVGSISRPWAAVTLLWAVAFVAVGERGAASFAGVAGAIRAREWDTHAGSSLDGGGTAWQRACTASPR